MTVNVMLNLILRSLVHSLKGRNSISSIKSKNLALFIKSKIANSKIRKKIQDIFNLQISRLIVFTNQKTKKMSFGKFSNLDKVPFQRPLKSANTQNSLTLTNIRYTSGSGTQRKGLRTVKSLKEELTVEDRCLRRIRSRQH